MSEPRHTLVVGGTRGIGRAVANTFAARGHAVSVLARRQPVEPLSSGVECWTGDLTDAQAVDRVLDEVVSARGVVQHVVFLQRYRGDGDPWTGEIETSLTGTKVVIESLANRFAVDGERSIVVIGSFIGRFVVQNQPIGYHVVKAGLEALVRYYAVLLGPRGIRVNAVAPCTILKEESQDFYLNNGPLLQFYREITPLQRMGQANEVASVAWFLTTPDASFVTAQTIVVDGGMSANALESTARRLLRI